MLHEKLLEDIARHVALLNEVADIERIDWSNWQILYAILHALQIHAQATINYLLHTCSRMLCTCETPISCVECLKNNALITDDEADLLKKMIRFRNILVHEYGSIDVERVKNILKERGYVKVLEMVKKIHEVLKTRGLLDP
ncbi:MAG: DUF86 domain-containing protein [Thermoprotei archaeon]|nr:MAG: DUF86 domain-containing protein [Thermoprotei archaeon]